MKKFDIKFEVKISTYAVPYIIGEIKRFIRDDGPIKLSRSLKELFIKIREIQNEYEKLGEEITTDELSKKLKVSKEDIFLAVEANKPITSIDEEIYDEDKGETKVNRIKNKNDEMSDIVNKLCLKQLISELKDNDRKIILLRYYKGKTQNEVAKALGISQVQVSRIEKKVLQEMKGKITN